MKCKHEQESGAETWPQRAERYKEKSKTHKQVKCPKCGLYAIWIRKVKNGS